MGERERERAERWGAFDREGERAERWNGTNARDEVEEE